MEDNYSREGYYYKYRSLANLERFLSIIIDKKLYGALYTEMNDPMEGHFRYNPGIKVDILDRINAGKQKTYICSLSQKGNIGLMWTHYADENKGCCIEVEVTAKSWHPLNVKYSERIPNLDKGMSTEDVLKVKAKMWEYEKEVRFIKESPNSRPMLSIKISRIFLGYKIGVKQVSFLNKVIKKLDPKIEVIKMKKDKLDYGYRK